MDPVTAGVISGLMTNAVTAAARSFTTARVVSAGKEKSSSKAPVRPQMVTRAFLAEMRTKPYDIDITRIAKYLRTPDAQTMIRQILAAQLTDEPERYDVQLRAQMTAQLVLCANLSEQSASDLGAALLSIIHEATQPIAKRILEQKKEDGVIRDTVWLTLLGYHLESIERTNRLYGSHGAPELASFHEFELAYRRQVHNAYELFSPPYARERVQVPLDDLYVLPSFRVLDSSRGEALEPGTNVYSTFLALLSRTVVLGDPGAGKSTLIAKLSYDLSGASSLSSSDFTAKTPITVILKDYQQQKRTHNNGILEYLEIRSKIRHLLVPPEGAIEYLMGSGRAVVLFDGLDELLETDARQEVTAEVQALANKYPQTSVIVTSRRIGYEEARLDPRVFKTVVLSNFGDESVRDYARKWFSLADNKGAHVADEFLEQSDEVRDLRSNPLMLGLLCNIYQGENYIPRNRPEVYEWCSTMLFEKWDLRRGIKVRVPYRAQLEPALKHLAYWIYSTEGLEGGVQHHQLIQRTKDYLLSREYENEDEAAAAAEELIEFCQGRAWVFTDVGSTGRGTPLYQFTHQTFLEYFAAGHLARINRTGTALWERLGRRIAKREWDIVAQIALQILDRQVEGAVEDFLSGLLEDLDDLKDAEPSEQHNVLSFAARCLEFVAPNAQITRRIVKECIEFCLSTSVDDFPSSKSWQKSRRDGVSEIIYQLMVVDPRNQLLVGRALLESCLQIIEESSQDRRLAALYVGLNLDKISDSFPSSRSAQFMEIPNTLSSNFAHQVIQSVETLAFLNNGLALSLFQRGVVSKSTLALWLNHGADPG